MLNKDFLKQVLAEEKQLLRKSEVIQIEVPQYEELAVKHIWPQFAKDKEMSLYFPDAFSPGKGPSREYFYNVLNTVYPEYLEKLMDHANKERMSADGVVGQTEGIQISEFWEEQLKAMQYLSSKCLHFRNAYCSFLSQRSPARLCIS